jgi:YVTN family beta-propeller protein
MAVALDERRQRLYASTGRGGTVAIIDLAKSQLLTEVAVGARPWGLALSRDGLRLYTANGPSNDVTVVDTSTKQVVTRIAVGSSPWGVVVGPPPPAHDDAAPPKLLRKTAAAASFALQFTKQLRQLLCLRGIPKDTAALAGQGGVFRVRAGFDELIVAQARRDPVNGARALVEIRQLVAACCDAFVHVLDAREGRVVIGGWITEHRSGTAQPGQRKETQNGTTMA